eukprot:CAMPEP_0198298402 /NCGR_PEP_ID=MMETSP1449-20131203/40858_1 /TAXON_ID=420275 /ORGANISM="Attheya septentrionalis, Strain CCMP2084" /LENGTH=312 /DNA_ID=CAMNT_0043999661 /DNA_START=41 /DNA_END=979 /DNA_ORIENTATION=-
MSEEGGDGPVIDVTVIIFIWIGALILFLVAPFCWTRQRRELCKRRVRARTWNVEIEEGEFEPEWFRLAVERYNASRANASSNGETTSPLSPEEREEIRLMYLFRQFSGFTKTLKTEDFHTVVDASDILTLQESSRQEDTRDLESGGNGCVAHVVTSNESSSEEADEENINPYMDDSNKYISLPAAGVNVSVISEGDNDAVSNEDQRDVPIGCAVCLCEFEPSVRVTWSSNSQCPHVFHEDCIMNWMLTVGRKKKRRRRGEPEDPPAHTEKDVVNFPMLCPCCRQNFVSLADDEPEETELPSESIDTTPQISR